MDNEPTKNSLENLAVARADGLSSTCSVCHDSDPGHLPLIGQVDGRQALPLSKSSSRQCQTAASLQKARHAVCDGRYWPSHQASAAATV